MSNVNKKKITVDAKLISPLTYKIFLVFCVILRVIHSLAFCAMLRSVTLWCFVSV